MGPDGRTVSPGEGPWKVADIVYVSIVGVIMLAALVEWFLGLAAFLYCLVKVYQKAEGWSTRVLAVVMIVFFTAMRGIFLPVMAVTLPLPAQLTRHYPPSMVSFLSWFAFWTFAGLLTVPWLFCIYQLIINSLGRTKRVKEVLDEETAPKVVIVMPCYQEEVDVLVTAVNSVVSCDYPPECLHVFLSFDGEEENELYLKTIEKLGVPLLPRNPLAIDVVYRGTRITVSRFPHGGKRQCQKRTYRLIDKIYEDYLKRNDNLFILFIDSDCILDRVCIQNFMYEMELKPGSKHTMLAMTGVITSTTSKNSMLTILQDMEYVHGQLFERSVESGCGAVTCLPGALTILRFSAFRNMAKYYFADKAEQCDDMFDYGKCHLGEDRWLTHLFMIGAQSRYQIGMCTGAFCKTEAVKTYASLLKQRRRWFLGFITNEACMLTDVRLWMKYPILCLIRLMQNTIRTTALLFFIMLLSIVTTSNKVTNLPLQFIGVSLGLNWVLMIYFGIRLRRYKIWAYPLMFIVNPFFNWAYMVYGVCTAGQRTWGGPRADAGAATEKTTPREVIARAEATGDDLNVVPESFRPATDSILRRSKSVPVHPSNRVAGRFVQAEMLPSGFYQMPPPQQQQQQQQQHQPHRRAADLSSSEALMLPRKPYEPRHSVESFQTTDTGPNAICMPRRVESIMGDEILQASAVQADHRTSQAASQRRGPSDGFERVSLDHHATDATDPPLSRHSGQRSVSFQDTASPQGYMPVRQAQESPVRTSSPGNSSARLALPETSHHPTARTSVTSRIARSPLGQLSFSRSSNAGDSSIELQEQQEQRLIGPDAGRAAEPSGAAGLSELPLPKQRKKLLKRFRKS